MSSPQRLHWLRAVLLFSCCTWFFVSASVLSPLEQSFFFDWNPPGQPYPVPVTQQCETIHITWGRGAATGPNPVSPYYLQVYTSAFLVPFIISAGDVLQYDWTVPFAPGTLYQICMFDRNGNTGGCQDVYTMIPSSSSSGPSCTNVTFLSPLEVDATVQNGPMSRYGWIDQCTDISLVPRNGTPPYTLTVAPSLHPPYNLTSDGATPLNWTVSLSRASSFFLSVVDGAGNVWSNGLLHSGGGGTTACLSSEQPKSDSGGLSSGVAVGAGLGGLAVGLVAGLLGTLIFFRSRSSKRSSAESLLDLRGGSHPGSPQGGLFHMPSINSHYRALPTSAGIMDNTHTSANSSNIGNRMTGVQYHVEPFVMPPANEDGRLRSPTSPVHNNASNPSVSNPAPDAAAPSSSGRLPSHVYVVHHDSGRAPVTVYTQEGTQVVELPPGYPGNANDGQPGPLQNPYSRSGHDSRSEVVGGGSSAVGSGSSDAGRTESSAPGAEPPAFLQQVRRPGQARKPATPTKNRPDTPS